MTSTQGWWLFGGIFVAVVLIIHAISTYYRDKETRRKMAVRRASWGRGRHIHTRAAVVKTTFKAFCPDCGMELDKKKDVTESTDGYTDYDKWRCRNCGWHKTMACGTDAGDIN